MGFYNLANPGRAGYAAAQYDGWAMSNIIRDFVFNKDLTDEHVRLAFRKALLVSDEVNMVSKGRHFNV